VDDGRHHAVAVTAGRSVGIVGPPDTISTTEADMVGEVAKREDRPVA